MKSRLSPHPWLIAACLLLAACTGSTTISPGPPTAFGLWRFTPAGALDTTFPFGATAPQGFTFTNVVPGGFSFALAAAVQADGKIVVAGSAGLAGQGTVALVRYNPDGTLDSTGFGTNGTGGVVQTPLPSPALASAIAVQPADQKIVVAALTFSTTSTTGIAVIRYKTDGTPDITFGTAGVVSNATVGQGLASDSCALVLQPDGKIVVAGASQAGKIVLFRYNIDGTADATFGTDTNGGSTTTSLGTGTVAMSPGLALLSDNSIIVVTGNSLDQVVLHYSTAGVLDLTFGNPTTTNGIVTTDVGGGQNFANAVAVQSGDKIVVVGHANVTPNTSDISLVRYNANGTLDTSFVGPAVNPNPPGIVVTELGAFDNAFSIALESPGTNILVSGNTGFGGGQAVVLRYTTTGALDTTFNPTSGFVTAPLFGPSNVASGNVVLQTPLGIVVAGFD